MTLQEEIIQLLNQYPQGLNDVEIALRLKRPRGSISGSLNTLEKKNKVIKDTTIRPARCKSLQTQVAQPQKSNENIIEMLMMKNKTLDMEKEKIAITLEVLNTLIL